MVFKALILIFLTLNVCNLSPSQVYRWPPSLWPGPSVLLCRDSGTHSRQTQLSPLFCQRILQGTLLVAPLKKELNRHLTKFTDTGFVNKYMYSVPTSLKHIYSNFCHVEPVFDRVASHFVPWSFRTQVISYLLWSFRTYFLVILYPVTTILYPGHFVPILVILYLGQLGTK